MVDGFFIVAFESQRNPQVVEVFYLLWFDTHGFSKMGEALIQLAGWLVAASSDFQNWFLVSKVKKSSFYGLSLPGDQIKLDVQLISEEGSGQITFKGLGTVNGKKKIMTEFEGEIVPLNELDDVEDQKNFFKILTRTSKR